MMLLDVLDLEPSLSIRFFTRADASGPENFERRGVLGVGDDGVMRERVLANLIGEGVSLAPGLRCVRRNRSSTSSTLMKPILW